MSLPRRTLLIGVFSIALVTLAVAPALGASGRAASPNVSSRTWVQTGPPPESASGCNNNVCIYVNGSGLQVNYVDSYAYPPAYVCTHATLLLNNSPIASGSTICINGPSEHGVTYFDTSGVTFHNGDVLCTKWHTSQANHARPFTASALTTALL